MSPALLLAAALLVQQAEPAEPDQPTAYVDEDGAHGWRCWASVTLGRYKGSVWRDYGRKLKHSAYMMQVELPGYDNRHTTIWSVDPRPAAPSPGRKSRWPFPRAEAEAFRSGPVSVLIDFKWKPAALVGPLWVQLWGDGAYVGSQVMMSARATRRYFGAAGPEQSGAGLTGTGTHPGKDLIARLASARTWTAVAVDSAGRPLASETFEVPTPREAEAAYREARGRIDALEPRFAATHEARDEGGASCGDHEDPAATI